MDLMRKMIKVILGFLGFAIPLAGCSVPVPRAIDHDCPQVFIVNDLSRQFRFLSGHPPASVRTNEPLVVRFEVERVIPRCERRSATQTVLSEAETLSFRTAVRVSASKGEAFEQHYPALDNNGQPQTATPSATLFVALATPDGEILARKDQPAVFHFAKPDETYTNNVETVEFENVAQATSAAMDQWQILVGLALTPQDVAYNRLTFPGGQAR